MALQSRPKGNITINTIARTGLERPSAQFIVSNGSGVIAKRYKIGIGAGNNIDEKITINGQR
jgi:hypothetical protein